jgi:putative ABC transport system permease protein
VRVALGATGGQVIRLFLGHAMIIIAAGVPAGLAIALVAARSLSSLVFGIGVTDVSTLAAVAALLVGITLIASYLPARSATRIDPLTALRQD